ncbi:MAG: S-methyl-5-thioribose-1-phosphate isomerase [archaeon GB-1867-005]|nr:S-methyl-5-thioribose-1-phosphate isomerase [Candidatus Culexmicrobium cathedralense]
MLPKTIEWKNGVVRLIDQTKLPSKLEFIECKNAERIASAIRNMEIRGAPAIGAAAAMALALTAYHSKAESADKLMKELKEAAELIRSTRPTAKNLFWAVERVLNAAEKCHDNLNSMVKAVIDEALRIAEEDVEANLAIGMHGAQLIDDGDTILTYCNAGSLATVYYGTALGVIRAAWTQGKKIRVIAPETRPKLQGARLTCFELLEEGIPVTLITDNSIGFLMQKGKIDKVIVGADRILQDGTTYNKIGTYTIAVLAEKHGIPFYVAAPTSTFDLTSTRDKVKIEERSPDEVRRICGCQIAPERVDVINYAFDMTPPELITAIITEVGVIRPPYRESIAEIMGKAGQVS